MDLGFSGHKRQLYLASIGTLILIFGSIGLIVYAIWIRNIWLLIIPGVILGFIFFSTVVERHDASAVPTPMSIVTRMLELAELREGETLYDLGSGDGRILFTAAKDFGAKAVGVEITKWKVIATRQKIVEEHFVDQVRVMQGNFFETDLSEADVVSMYLRQDTNDKLREKLKKELKPGARVVSYTFVMHGWKPYKEDTADEIYVYKI